VSFLFGSPSGEAGQVGQYFQNAGNQILGSVTGPVGQSFLADQNAALQPQFAQNAQQLAAKEAAMGITNSGAAKADFSNLGAQQASVLAGADAPLYAQALGAFDTNATSGAGAQGNAYMTGVNQVDQGIAGLANAAGMMFGAPGVGSLVGGGNPYSSVADQVSANNGDPYGLVAGFAET